MKNLNVRWVPGTFAIVSLSIAIFPEAPSRNDRIEPAGARGMTATTPTKLIVISGDKNLKANVKMSTP